MILRMAKLHHRLIQHKLRYGSPVLPPFLRRTIKTRDALFTRYQKCRPSSHKDVLHGRWKSASRLTDCYFRNFHHRQVIDAATSTRDQKKFWTLVESVVDMQSVLPLKDNHTGDFVFSDVDKANVLNKYFASYPVSSNILTASPRCYLPHRSLPL